jgi:hypothetical protein
MFASKDLFFSKPSGYQISRSVRTRASATAYFSRTPASTTNQKTLTWSGWVKRGALGIDATILGTADSTGSGYNVSLLRFTTTDILRFVTTNNAGSSVLQFDTTAVFRDPSAWYHIVLYIDTTQATNSNGIRIYVNGVNQAGTYAAYTQNTNTFYNSTIAQYIGRWGSITPSAYFDGYMTEVNFIDGQALTPSSFGQTNTITGVWQPLKYTGTYGTNGFYLNFSDNSNNTAATIGKDYSGNGNNWTPNNISVTAGVTYDSMLDVPTLYADGGNGRGNYAVLNAVDTATSSTLTNGNLTAAISSNTGSSQAGSIVVSTGKWYWEVDETSVTNQSARLGILRGNLRPSAVSVSTNPNGVYYTSDATKIVDGTTTAYGSSWSTTGASYNIGVALDADAGTVTFYLGGVSQGAITLPSNTEGWKAHAMWGSIGGTGTFNFNFGQRPFTYTPPTGFVALNTQNLPTPTISNGANYMAATTYTGTGATQTISNAVNGVSFQPDLVWAKSRSAVESNRLIDSVRGATLVLYSNLTNAETTEATGLTAFGSSGFTLGSGSPNTSAVTYVGWQWNAGGSTVTNTSGSISAQVRANTTAGFSVVTYTGTGANATVGHGLGVAPKMVIVKQRSAVRGWPTYHASLTSATYYVDLQTTAAQASAATIWNSTAPSSTVFSIGTDTGTNQSTGTYVAYCFSEVAGYSKFGSYTGNGSADGPFIYCGFRPRWVMVKRTDAVAPWDLIDTARDSINEASNFLYPNLSSAEAVGTAGLYRLDILSNGFKLRGNGSEINSNASTYIFAAFAENPFKNSLAR